MVKSDLLLFGFTYLQIAVAVGVFVASTLATSAVVAAFLVWIPADHFIVDPAEQNRRRSWPLAIAKNVLGVVLVLVGIVLSFPGVPGQGLLTIFVGLLMLDIPGKRRFELRLMRRDAICSNVDKLRRRFDKPPILLDADAVQHPDVIDS